MAINFNQNSAFNLKPINKESVRGEVMGLLVNGEEIAYAFQTVRDQLIFTNKRIIAVDVQGITGKRKSFTTMPYSRIQYFTIHSYVSPSSAFLGENSISRWPDFRSRHSARMWS